MHADTCPAPPLWLQDGRLNVFYSTPADYVAAKKAYTDVAWPLKTDDFFPYADCPHCYWTGYFTSRPTSKGFIRQMTAYLQVRGWRGWRGCRDAAAGHRLWCAAAGHVAV